MDIESVAALQWLIPRRTASGDSKTCRCCSPGERESESDAIYGTPPTGGIGEHVPFDVPFGGYVPFTAAQH